MKHSLWAAAAAVTLSGVASQACGVETAGVNIASAISAQSTPGDWRSIITAEDQKRLDNLWSTRGGAMGEAEDAIARQEPEARAAAKATHDVLNAVPTLVQDSDVVGRYRCRVTKLGGKLLGLIAYPFFRCQIHQGPDGSLVIKKTSGSQRFIGRLWRDADEASYIYLGSSYVNDAQPPAYNTTPRENQTGRLFRLGVNRLRLELPKPHYESNLDVVELRRIR